MIADLQMIIIVILTAVVAAGLGMLWGVSRYTHIYDWFSASFFSRMQKAMKGLGYSQNNIDMVLDKMGQRIMVNIPPPPTPPVKDGDVESTRKVILEEQRISLGWKPSIPDSDIPILRELCICYEYRIREAFTPDGIATIDQIQEDMALQLLAKSNFNYGIRIPKVRITTNGNDGFIFVSFDRL